MGSSTVGLVPGLSSKLKKVLECWTDLPNLLSSLNTLLSFYTENTPQSRRNLRYTIETSALDINCEFLRASDPAQRALDRVVEKKSFSEKTSVYSPWPREIQRLCFSTIFFICWSLLSLSTSRSLRSRRSSIEISSSSLSSEHLQSKFAFEIGKVFALTDLILVEEFSTVIFFFLFFNFWVCVLESEFVFLLLLFKTHLDLNSYNF